MACFKLIGDVQMVMVGPFGDGWGAWYYQVRHLEFHCRLIRHNVKVVVDGFLVRHVLEGEMTPEREK